MYRAWTIAALLFGSGLCALVYQTVWLRQFRLIFGASTPASAAVLALFMAGLGVGGLVLGRRVERAKEPLLLYAKLEVGVALSAALSPFLLDLVRAAYRATGGALALGSPWATVLRLGLAALVLGVPVILMGGTLPAASRAAVGLGDVGRRGLAVLYGVNTLGAVVGALATTFFLFEVYGTRLTLWLACLLNGVVVLAARMVSRQLKGAGRNAEAPSPSRIEAAPGVDEVPSLPRVPVLLSAFVAGFVFFLIELVWYRMSSPILGGSTYTFGLVLALALLGIGLGGTLYAFAPPRTPKPAHLALTFALEALFLLLPFLAGDGLAHLAFFLREFGMPSFPRLVLSWSAVASLLVLPAAMVSGYQFPLLLALIGRGRDRVATDVAQVYAANTVGSILGSLAGGFGLLPVLTAPGAWRLSGALLTLVGLVLALLALRTTRRQALVAIGVSGLALVLLAAEGPTALWRHSSIGAGRAQLHAVSQNVWRNQVNAVKQTVLEEHEGRESSVAFIATSGLTFMVNGKADGNAVDDAMTTVGLGMLPAALHPAPKRAFVIGLGTGQTAGWLGRVPEMERVDVVEIEPAVLRFAELCSESNERLFENPKVQVLLGDGREVLTTRKEQYDLIVSEPSNPYRAGIASFYTVDFYREAEARLAPGGIFGQWVQAYEIDAQTLQLVIATLSEVFPEVSLWRLGPGDLLLVGAREPLALDAAALRARLAAPIFEKAFNRVLGVFDVEGLLAMHLTNHDMLEALTAHSGARNYDDHPLLEYRFARTVGRSGASVTLSRVLEVARERGADRPRLGGEVDWERVEQLRGRAHQVAGKGYRSFKSTAPDAHTAFWSAIEANDFARAASLLDDLSAPPAQDLFARLARAEARAAQSPLVEEQRAALEDELVALGRAGFAADVGWIRVRRALTDGELDRVPTLVEEAARATRADPWMNPARLSRGLDLLTGFTDAELAEVIARPLLEGPFASYNQESSRLQVVQRLVTRGMPARVSPLCVAAFDRWVPWTFEALRDRALCFQTHAPERAEAALAELDELRSFEHIDLAGLVPAAFSPRR